MKKIISLILICVTALSFTACCDNSSAQNDNSSKAYSYYDSTNAVSEAYNIRFATTEKEYPVGTEEITAVIYNNSEYALGYSEVYQLEKYDEKAKGYYECSLSEDFNGFISIYSSSPPGAEINRRVELKCFEGLVPGKYRVVVRPNFMANADPFETEDVIVNGENGVVLCAEFILK